MAAKKISIYKEVNTDEELLESLHTQGLACIEIASQFCGYAKAMEQTTRRIFMDRGDRPIHFLRILAENSELFAPLRARSAPHFVIVKNGVFVEMLTGLDPTKFEPAILKSAPASLDDCPREKDLPPFDTDHLMHIMSALDTPKPPAEYLTVFEEEEEADE
ncbi:hypothetical protein J8273_8021 [Carpediemonas membranifera]|uniref:Thioredoxin domain-containing protein n=1 Tax=Carpediemonas membranifera TaxID=201153 RepID=A0A8J6E7F4_9EUKA|nr:hypothetical protein J8273_8021 [Carpediemonas membranifera]|eukprot:KAG9390655.1 hypothetical protein J8273_8021 [Carpediemonas membranifera]